MACAIAPRQKEFWNEETKDVYAAKKQIYIHSAPLISLLETFRVPYEKVPIKMRQVNRVVLGGSTRSCESFMCIWPAVLENHQMLVAAMMMESKFSPRLQSIAQLASVRDDTCGYAQAHFALQCLSNGVPSNIVKSILASEFHDNLSACERAAVATGLRVTSDFADIDENQSSLELASGSAQVARSIAMSICCAGYFQKFVQAIGIELEPEVYQAVHRVLPYESLRRFSFTEEDLDSNHSNNDLAVSCPKETPQNLSWWMPKFAKNWQATAIAKRYTLSRTAQIPSENLDELSSHLQSRLGYNFPVLSALSQKSRAALALILIDSLDRPGLAIESKVLACCIFARVHRCKPLERAFFSIARHFNVSTSLARILADGPVLDSIASLGPSAKAAMYRQRVDNKSQNYLLLARAIAPTSIELSHTLIGALRDAIADPRAIVDLVATMALCETLRRIHHFFEQEEAIGVHRHASYSSSSSSEEAESYDDSIDDLSWQLPRYDSAPLIEDEDEEED